MALDSLVGEWEYSVMVTDIERPSGTCEYSGSMSLRRPAVADPTDAPLVGAILANRACEHEGQLSELRFDGPVSLVEDAGDRSIVGPDCRLAIEELRQSETLALIRGVARCVVQEMRAPRILEGSWEARRRVDVEKWESRRSS